MGAPDIFHFQNKSFFRSSLKSWRHFIFANERLFTIDNIKLRRQMDGHASIQNFMLVKNVCTYTYIYICFLLGIANVLPIRIHQASPGDGCKNCIFLSFNNYFKTRYYVRRCPIQAIPSSDRCTNNKF